MQYNTKAGNGKFSGRVTSTTVQSFPGQIGNNVTGASLGGLAETSSGYVVAYNYNGTGGSSPDECLVYLAYVPKRGGSATVHALSSSWGTTPHLVPTGLNGGYILWNEKSDSFANDTLYYASYDSGGNVGTVRSTTASLSDCAPTFYNGKVVWYTTDNSAPVFYSLDENGVTATPVDGSSQPTQPEQPQQPDQPNQDDFVIGSAEEYRAYWNTHSSPSTYIATGRTVPEDANILIRYTGDGRTVTIPEGVTYIGTCAFTGCDNVTGVVIPGSVSEIGYGAFAECGNLIDVVIENGVKTIGEVAFAHCSDLTSVTLPESLSEIDMQAFFNCPSLRIVTLPNSLKELPYGAFMSCVGMESVAIPASVTKIANTAFYNCGQLYDVYYGGTEAQWDAIDFSAEWNPSVRIHFNSDMWTQQPAASSFSDVPTSHWAYSYVEKAAEAGWVAGIGGGLFGVDNQVTYAEFCTMLVRAYCSDELSAYSGPAPEWYTSYGNVAQEAGLLEHTDAKGMIGDAVTMNRPVSRFDMAQMAYNVLLKEDIKLDFDTETVLAGIPDQDSIMTVDREAVAGVVTAGIIGGVDDRGTFDGFSFMTRGQAAVVMSRLSELLG